MKPRLLPAYAAAATLALFAALAIALLSAPLLVRPASADVLWDQSAIDEFGAGFFNSISGTPPFGSTLYAVSDVTVGAGGWEVQSISVWFSGLDPSWGAAITEGRLVVFAKSGPLPIPANDPSTAPTVPMTGTYVPGPINNHWQVTATGLGLSLVPGEYWIGITPVAPSGFFGPEIHSSTTTPMGDSSPWYDPYAAMGPEGWSVPNAGVDATILIEGTTNIPVPAATRTWGSIKNLYR